MTFGRLVRASSLGALVGLAAATAAAQPDVEECGPAASSKAVASYRAGALRRGDGFQTVAEGYPTSTVADDALLAVADYQLKECAGI